MAICKEGLLQKMGVLLIITLLGITQICAVEFVVTHAPKYITFVDKPEPLPTSEIPAVLASAFGIPLKQDVHWNGLRAGSVFHRPKAAVLVSVEGHGEPLGLKSIARFPLKMDNPVVDMEALSFRIQDTVADIKPMIVDFSVDNTIFDVKSQYPKLFKHLPTTYRKVKEMFVNGQAFIPSELGSLNYTQDIDLSYLGELHIIRQILQSLQHHKEVTKGSTPDLYHFKVTGLGKLAKEYGVKSSQYNDAVALLETIIQELTTEFQKLYLDNVMVQIVSLPVPPPHSHSRHTRSLKQENKIEDSQDDKEKEINYAEDWDDLFPVTFNIILWTSIILGLALFAIGWSLWNMDPGRDSIIYRMTSQRMKKE